MKKYIALMASVALATGMMTGCGNDEVIPDGYVSTEAEQEYQETARREVIIDEAEAMEAPTDKQIAEQYIEAHYTDLPVEYLHGWQWDRIASRDDSTVIVVVSESTSDGNGGGYDEEGCYTRYNTTVDEGVTVTSYYIYNPANQYEDDIVAVVDNGMIR